MVTSYIPKRGDVLWLDFNPQTGHEQAGRRPALILSPLAYNQKTSLALVCPITNQIKAYPFEVLIPENLPIKGVVLCDQVKSLDWKQRNASFICELPNQDLQLVTAKLKALLI
jgi:mRNA interferase MazF